MRSDWLWGLGATSALMVLVGIDLALSVIADRAAHAIREKIKAPSRRP